MGTLLLQLPTSALLILNPNNSNKSRVFSNSIVRCGPTRSRATRGPGQDAGRFRFNMEDELYADGDDIDDEFGFSSAAKQRIWWSKDDDYDAWEFDEDDEFWFFKVFRAFGWMLPAIAISLLLGTGPNAFLMALAVPLGQAVLSLAFDKVWGSSSQKSRPRTRTRKRPFTRAATASDMKTSEPKVEENVTRGGKGSYQSWVVANAGSHEKGNRGIPRFGGWGELDIGIGSQKLPKEGPSQKANRRPKQQKKGKFSQIGRVRDKPLLLRLLIAVFPFLGSWTKLLF